MENIGLIEGVRGGERGFLRGFEGVGYLIFTLYYR